MSDCGCDIGVKTADQARVLWVLLAINGAMFLGELGAGLVAESTALVSDSFDMLADAIVYGISLHAAYRATATRSRAARYSGAFQIALGLLALAEVVRRSVAGSEPDPFPIVGVGMVALAANVYCLRLISQHRGGGVHMEASYIFSQNDVIANCAAIAGGGLVYLSGWSGWDLLVGMGIGTLVLSGGYRILRRAREADAASAT